jgi:hypothetical protein
MNRFRERVNFDQCTTDGCTNFQRENDLGGICYPCWLEDIKDRKRDVRINNGKVGP